MDVTYMTWPLMAKTSCRGKWLWDKNEWGVHLRTTLSGPTGTDYQQTITDIHKANRFHVIKLISLHSVEFLPKATFRSLLCHHSYVLEHAADDLTAHTPRHVPCRWQNQLPVLQRYYYFINLQSYHWLDLPLLLLQCVHEKRPQV